jgi:calcineurin-like phosphoesterase family protein
MKYFTSDWHLSHQNIIRFANRPFASVEEMDDIIIKNVLSVVKDGDSIFFLGDFTWNREAGFRFFSQLSGAVEFHWILGNHDKEWKTYKDRCTSINQIKETVIQGHPVTLCHYPMISWNKSHYNAWQLFGHHHAPREAKIDKQVTGKAFNVNLEFNDYKMYSENDIADIMARKGNNWNKLR